MALFTPMYTSLQDDLSIMNHLFNQYAIFELELYVHDAISHKRRFRQQLEQSLIDDRLTEDDVVLFMEIMRLIDLDIVCLNIEKNKFLNRTT